MIEWLGKSIWNVVILIAGVAVAAFLAASCLGGVAAVAFWPKAKTVEVVHTQIVEVPAEPVIMTVVVPVFEPQPENTPMPNNDIDSTGGDQAVPNGYLPTDGTGYGKSENFEAPSHHLNAGKPLVITLAPGVIHFNIACGGCPEGVENNFVAVYDGPVKTVTLSEGSAFWYHMSFKDHPDELWKRTMRDSLNDYWPSQLSAELAAIKGLTLLEPELGFRDQ